MLLVWNRLFCDLARDNQQLTGWSPYNGQVETETPIGSSFSYSYRVVFQKMLDDYNDVVIKCWWSPQEEGVGCSKQQVFPSVKNQGYRTSRTRRSPSRCLEARTCTHSTIHFAQRLWRLSIFPVCWKQMDCHIPNFGPIKFFFIKTNRWDLNLDLIIVEPPFPKPQKYPGICLFFEYKKGLNPSLPKEVCQRWLQKFPKNSRVILS